MISAVRLLLLLLLLIVGDGAFLWAETKLKIGVYQNNPKVFVAPDGQAEGFFVDITEEIARRNHYSLQYLPGSWSDHIERIEAGEIDVLLDVSYLDERAERFRFNKIPVIESWIQPFSLAGGKIKKLEEFRGRTIAVIRGSTQERYLTEEIRSKLGVECRILSLEDYSDMIHAVQTAEADLFLGDRFFLFSSDKPEEIVPSPIVLRPRGLYFAFRKGLDERVVAAFDETLFSLKNNGDTVYYRSFNRWFNYSKDRSSPLFTLMLVLFPLALLVLGAVIVWNQQLHRQVRRQTEKLAESEQRFGFMVKNSNDMLVIIAEDGRQKFVSPVARRVTGYSVEELEVPFWELIHPDDLETVLKAWDQCLSHPEKAILVQYRHRHNARGWIDLEAVAQSYLSHPAIEGVIVNVRDISERKEAEQEKERLQAQLIHAQKMESVGRLAGGIAHDFNNMLSVILSNAELGMMKETRDNPLYRRLAEIKRAAVRSSDLTRQLLSFARKELTVPRTISLEDSIGQMMDMLRRLIGENIVLNWLPGDSLWPVRIDPSQLDQILANLCVNARDAIGGSGGIVIRAENRVVDDSFCRDHPFFKTGEYVLLTVCDDGAGMDEETCKVIFEPFFTTKQPGQGTGLGLSIVYGIVKQNSGYILVESRPLRGTCFSIYLPRSDKNGATSEPDLPDSARRGSERILLVEDEPMIVEIASAMLEALGYRVVTAEKPKTALELAEKSGEPFDLLLTDVIMPEMDGPELAGRIAGLLPGIRTLYMSGEPARAVVGDGPEGNKVFFIRKPFTIDELSVTIRRVLDS